MSISRRNVEYIAELARIALTEEEKTKFEKDLSAILEFVEKLNEVDTENVEPMAGGTTLDSIMREDEQIDLNLEGHQANILAQVPEKKEEWVKVKSVL